MAHAAFVINIPLLAAVAGAVAWVLVPGAWLAALPLLVCPGWGLLRLASVIDRRFGVIGCSLCLSVLLLGGVMRGFHALGDAPESLGLWLHVMSILLCLMGSLRLGAFQRRQRLRPTHPEPMALWPVRLWVCLPVLAAALGALWWAQPPDRASLGTGQLFAAAEAFAFTRLPATPVLAGLPLSTGGLLSHAAAGLSLGTDTSPLWSVWLVTAACLVATLLLAAECISRLWGNRGGSRAMLAVLLGLNPLAALFLFGAKDGLGTMTPGFDPDLTTALDPFLRPSDLTPALAFLTMLMACTLSVMRRASFHVPRLVALSAFGLVLAHPWAAAVVLPGWVLGIVAAHVACRGHPDNDLDPGNPARRADEPLVLRAPLWRLLFPLLLGAGAGVVLIPESVPRLLASGLVFEPARMFEPGLLLEPSRIRAWGLLATLGPACILFVPGVRNLNRAPGREAYFFLGVLTVTAALGTTLVVPDDEGELAARLLALVLAVPIANGAMALVKRFGLGGRLMLAAMVGVALPGPLLVLNDIATAPHKIFQRDGVLQHPRFGGTEEISSLLETIRERAPRNALYAGDIDASWPDLATLDERADLLATVHIITGLTILPATATEGISDSELETLTRLAADLPRGRLMALRARPETWEREIWSSIARDAEPWPGFDRVVTDAADEVVLVRNRVPSIVLVTVPGLRLDRITPAHAPRLAALASRPGLGTLLTQVISPRPDTQAGLTCLLSGRSALDDLAEDASLAKELRRRGYRTAAVVTTTVSDPGLARLMGDFDTLLEQPGRTVDEAVQAALDLLATPDPTPLFLWVHLSDLTLPFRVPPPPRISGEIFPPHGDLDRLHFGEVSDPFGEEGGLDLQTGVLRYDRLVSIVDDALGQLAESLFWQDVFIVTAPHGMNLVEHDAPFDHGRDLFEASVRVPVVMVGPEVPDATDADALWSLADLAPLLLVGERADRDLVRLQSRPRPASGSDEPDAAGSLWGERSERFKTVLLRPGSPAYGVAFDLRRDAAELRPLPADPEVLERIDEWRRLRAKER